MGKPPDPSDFVDSLAPALRRAASIARDLEGRVGNHPKPGEASPVKAALTMADTAAQEALLAPLLECFPGVALEAEEDTPAVARFPASGDGLVVIDPIDGTLRFYLEALGPYAVMMGLAVGGAYQAALLALPRERIFLDGVRGRRARFARGEAVPVTARAEPRGHRVLISHDLPGAAVEVLLAAGFRVSPASGGAISVAPLLPGIAAGLRFVRDGSVSVRGRIGALIAAEAGALVRVEDGSPFPDDIRAPARALLLAASEDDLGVLCDAAAAAAAALAEP
jgi:3'(2'), 5'-bisphosphate nucleotidase